MPRASLLMTLYNRPRAVLQHTLQMIRRNDLRNTEIVIVNDGSTKDYSRLKSYCEQHEMPVKWVDIDTIKDNPGTYNIDGYNNPVYAWNRALDESSGEVVICLASDCLIPPHGLKRARTPGKALWMSGVIDMDTGMQYLGLARVRPYGWFMSWNRNHYDVRWDESYLKGMGFDDNDFTARLALAAKQIHLDLQVTAFHQSHKPVAYSDGHRGHDINEIYTHKKWGGIPWMGDDNDPLAVRMATCDNKHVICVERKRQAERETLVEQHAMY